MTHALKTWPAYYKYVEDGSKPFEVRKMDRPFKTGDTVILQEYDPVNGGYTGKEKTFKIGYVLIDTPFVKKGSCVFGLIEPPNYEN